MIEQMNHQKLPHDDKNIERVTLNNVSKHRLASLFLRGHLLLHSRNFCVPWTTIARTDGVEIINYVSYMRESRKISGREEGSYDVAT